ncbi:hypothetical protein ACVRWL_03465 [Streptococcus ratti]|uniref:Uncharacterized protein n=2 Tax=Streptococcus ratti TaxID=1341 RepID=A0A7X9LCR9_STRRT|nr:hypothetical protein [Streptococcus ratti]VEI59727.1 Uncharacterised protein [Streptococcus mutans]EJN93398.1 hypothetical protein SRA_02641 [Streptococcus ratti FA-1 = DSM 20564]EMP69473.1 hypothetical protein D822_07988 [Streptococcus ratti FA-1 = DSM 20564]NMD48352.1 hypothetical protein [Streptococcus ratti]QEY07288.1 hypothetical protein FY406_06405 [Streptococcus ratti]
MALCFQVTVVGLVMSLVFNGALARLWLAYPTAVTAMLPKQIQQLAPKPDLLQRKKMRKRLFWIYLLILGLGLVTTAFLPIRGFLPLFVTGYWQMFLVNLGDLIGLDWLFRQKKLSQLMIPGTEDCSAWQTKIWMVSLGLPEHLLLWPLVVCPLVGLLYQVLQFL